MHMNMMQQAPGQMNMPNMQVMGQPSQMENQPNMGMTQQQQNQNFINNHRKTEINQKYKTERCRHYETHKNCMLGDKCHFAHGDEEMRKPDDQLSQNQMNMALKSVQWHNCNQGAKGGGQGGGGGGRGGG